MKTLKKFDISKCTPPERLPQAKPIQMTPIEDIEFLWQKEHAVEHQKKFFAMIERQNSIKNWDGKLNDILIELKEEIKRDSN